MNVHRTLAWSATGGSLAIGMSDRADEGPGALGREVRARRRALGLTQQQVADLAGASTRFVHTIEQGKPSLRLDRLLDVLEVLGLGMRLVPEPGLHGSVQEDTATDRPRGD